MVYINLDTIIRDTNLQINLSCCSIDYTNTFISLNDIEIFLLYLYNDEFIIKFKQIPDRNSLDNLYTYINYFLQNYVYLNLTASSDVKNIFFSNKIKIIYNHIITLLYKCDKKLIIKYKNKHDIEFFIINVPLCNFNFTIENTLIYIPTYLFHIQD